MKAMIFSDLITVKELDSHALGVTVLLPSS